jgi:hypothetical protein
MTDTDKLILILESPRLKKTSTAFAESLLAQSKSKELSISQKKYMEDMWDVCFPSPETLLAEAEWEKNYTNEMSENFRIFAQFMVNKYENRFYKSYVDNPKLIPARDQFVNATTVPWKMKIIENFKRPFLFEDGDVVKFRQTAKNRYKHGKEAITSPLLIIKKIKCSNRNNKAIYTCSIMENMENLETVELLESEIMKHK